MTKQVQRRRGTATQHTSFTGAEGEVSVNTTNKSVHVHDGVTAGGIEGARADMTNVSDGDLNSRLAGNTLSSLTITSADINGGTIDGTVIGGTTPAAGSFTTGSFTGNATFGDNDKAIFGAGSDLQIYHDGSNSWIKEEGTGSLIIRATDFYIQSGVTGESYVSAVLNGAVTLYYDDVSKLSTTATGIDVTGTVTADGLTVDGNPVINGTSPQLFFQTPLANYNWQIAAQENVSNAFEISSGNADAVASDDTYTKRLVVQNTGDISFYEDTGTTPKFHWSASAEVLTVDNRIKAGTASDGVSIGSASGKGEVLGVDTAGNGWNPLDIRSGSATQLYLNTDGNVGIGTSSPWESLSLPFGSGLSFGSATYPLTISRASSGQLVTTIADGYDSSSARIDFVMRNGHAAQNTALSITGNGHAIIPAGVTLGTSAGVYNAANTLDDYEEGTWTPSLSTSGARTGTWTTLTGKYTKTGNVVVAHMNVVGTAIGFSTLTGYQQVLGLPFSAGAFDGVGTWTHTSVATGTAGSAYTVAGGAYLWMMAPSNTTTSNEISLTVTYTTA